MGNLSKHTSTSCFIGDCGRSCAGSRRQANSWVNKKEGLFMTKNRHTELGLTDEQVLDMFKTMLLARKIDERMSLLNRAGKIPFVISCQGQEAAQVGASFALDREKDY